MNSKRIFWYLFISVFALSLVVNVQADQLQQDSELQIYLPREITLSEGNLILGQIGIIRGSESLIKKADQISLGRFSMPGQEIVVPRQTILSRLASNGIYSSQVIFKGAQEVTVKRKQQVIGSDDFLNMAESFLKENINNASVSGFKSVRNAQELVLSDINEDIKYSYSIEKNAQSNQVKVNISISTENGIIDSRSVTFRIEYENRVPVAAIDIAPGTIINPDNVKIEKRTSNNPDSADLQLPYGQIAKRAISANSVIRDDMIVSKASQTVLKRNQNVIIRVEKPGFIITASGKTMQDGKVGEYIKVKNIDSQIIIIAKVNEDGSVEPL